jgi:hypothetical protein
MEKKRGRIREHHIFTCERYEWWMFVVIHFFFFSLFLSHSLDNDWTLMEADPTLHSLR